MTLSPDDLAAMGRRHVATLDEQSMSEFCHYDGLSWPCDSRRLLDEVEALRVEADRYRREAESRQHTTETIAEACRTAQREKTHFEKLAWSARIKRDEWAQRASNYHAALKRAEAQLEEVMTQTANEPST